MEEKENEQALLFKCQCIKHESINWGHHFYVFYWGHLVVFFLDDVSVDVAFCSQDFHLQRTEPGNSRLPQTSSRKEEDPFLLCGAWRNQLVKLENFTPKFSGSLYFLLTRLKSRKL